MPLWTSPVTLKKSNDSAGTITNEKDAYINCLKQPLHGQLENRQPYDKTAVFYHMVNNSFTISAIFRQWKR